MATPTNTARDASLTTSLGGTPSGGDSVRIDRDGVPFTTDTDLSAVDLLRFEVGPNWRQSQETAVRLVVDQTSTGVFRYNGAGPKWVLESSSGSGVINRIEHVPVNGCQLVLGQMDAALALVAAGSVLLADVCDLDTLILKGNAQAQSLRHSGGAKDLQTVTLDGQSLLETYKDIGTSVTLRGGSRLRVLDYRVTIASLLVHGQDAEAYIAEGGTITAMTLYGHLNLRDLARPLAITNCTLGHAWRPGFGGGARITWPRGGKDLVTFTNPPTLEGDDPQDYGA